MQWQHKYLHVRKKTLIEKKYTHAFLIKKHVYMLDQAQNKKHLATAKQLIRKKSACYLKIRNFFFSQSERTYRSDPSPPSPHPVCFSSLFKDPPARRAYFFNDPWCFLGKYCQDLQNLVAAFYALCAPQTICILQIGWFNWCLWKPRWFSVVYYRIWLEGYQVMCVRSFSFAKGN